MSGVPEPALLLDLDRTLFDTDRYTNALLQAIAPQLGMTAATLTAEVPTEYVVSPLGGGSYYDMTRHLSRHGLAFSDIEQCAMGLPDDFLFPDAIRLLRALSASSRDAQVLTHGEQKTQELKLVVCQPLGSLAAHVTLTPKGVFIAEHWPETKGMIIDDKDIADLPEGWMGVRINRAANAGVQELTGSSSFQISSLDYVLPLFDRFYAAS